MRFPLMVFFLLCFVACKLELLDSNPDLTAPKYALALNIKKAERFTYQIENSTETAASLEGKENTSSTVNRLTVEYSISPSDSGILNLIMLPKLVEIERDNGVEKINYSSKNAGNSIVLTEKLLGIMTNSILSAKLTQTGAVVETKGYDQLLDKIIQTADPTNQLKDSSAIERFNTTVRNEFIEKNLLQLFQIFPDSAIRIGEKWKITSKIPGDLPFFVQSIFRLTRVEGNKVYVDVKSEVKSDGNTIAQVASGSLQLSGQQEGSYIIDAPTGILLEAKNEGELKGAMTSFGREVPVKIKTKLKLLGRK